MAIPQCWHRSWRGKLVPLGPNGPCCTKKKAPQRGQRARLTRYQETPYAVSDTPRGITYGHQPGFWYAPTSVSMLSIVSGKETQWARRHQMIRLSALRCPSVGFTPDPAASSAFGPIAA